MLIRPPAPTLREASHPAAERAPRPGRCACGGIPDSTGQCAACRARRLRRLRSPRAEPTAGPADRVAPAQVHDVLRAPGRPLDAAVLPEMPQRRAPDLLRVRIHTDAAAAASAGAIGASAYTVGHHVVFGAGRYQPATPEGRATLAHELTHAAQQGIAPATGHHTLPILAPDSAAERQAERGGVLAGTEPPVRTVASVARQLLARPPVRPPARPLPRQGQQRPGVRAPEGQRYAPEPWDDSLEAMFERANVRSARERVRLEQERPVMTLQRGGTAPHFITEHGTRTYDWIGGAAGGGSVTVRVRRFHVLDAIEYEVGRATSEEELQDIADRHVPVLGLANRAIGWFQGRPTALRPLRLGGGLDVSTEPPDLDPGARVRLGVFEEAVGRRSQAVPALAQSRLFARRTRRGGCRLEPISPLGGDPLSSLYCHAVTGSPYSYRITIETAAGAVTATSRWAEIDALRGNTWFECKCGYEELLTGRARGEAGARGALEKLDKQVLNHADIARTCGLEYRYIVSNDRVAELLRDRWFGNVVVDVRPWDQCD